MRRVVCLAGLLAAAAACNNRVEIQLDYQLQGIQPTDVIRVETLLDTDAADGRVFFADQPFREVDTGIGYEVRDFDGSGRRKILLTHDATLGYGFTQTFRFVLLPPVDGAAPKLQLTAKASNASVVLGHTSAIGVAFGSAARVDVVIADQRCGGRICNSDEMCCGTSCTSVLADNNNCGGCGHKCDTTETCSGAICACQGGPACASGQSCCASGCVDTTADNNNCGACGHKCNPGETCSGGSCRCGGGNDCNAFGNSPLCCPAPTGCTASGTCACGGSNCDAPRTCCPNNACVDTRSDNANCGGCGIVCGAGLTCTNSVCGCNGSSVVCTASCCASGCADTNSNPANCGSCGHACGASETCSQGMCQCGTNPGCVAGTTCCGSSCVNLGSDLANCGSCSNACQANETCNGACHCAGGGACTPGQHCCLPDPSAGYAGGCFDFSSDNANCGACNKPCGTGQACLGGVCKTVGCTPACLAAGNQCNSSGGAGVCSCYGSAPCASPLLCCQDPNGGGLCVNPASDPAHCGGCTNACKVAQLCCSGGCIDRGDNNCNACGDSCGKLQSCCVSCSNNVYTGRCIASGILCNVVGTCGGPP